MHDFQRHPARHRRITRQLSLFPEFDDVVVDDEIVLDDPPAHIALHLGQLSLDDEEEVLILCW